jgi:tetratricopeptide (TPR) repeat protein
MTKLEKTTSLRMSLNHAARLLNDDPALARRQVNEILKVHPEDPNARTLLGTCQRLSGQAGESLKTLKRVVLEQPDFGIGHLELGLTLQSLGDTRQAQESLERAMVLVPDLAAGWKALGDVRAANGDDEGSQEAYQNHLLKVAGHDELIEASNLVLGGKLAQAEPICREFLKRHPTNVSAIRLLADIGIKVGRLNDAEALLRRCLELAPDFHMARYNYANLLLKKIQYEPALTEINKLTEIFPDNPSYCMLKASIIGSIGDHESAITIYERILSNYPNQGRSWLSLGHALKTIGRQDDAVEAYRKAIEVKPGMGEAYWSLANLKTYHFDADTIETMRHEALSKGGKVDDCYDLYFSLGKALEDDDRYEEAFEAYRRGNLIRRETVRWDADAHHDNMYDLVNFFEPAVFAERTGQGCQASDPIFIIGLPRAGSTLLEQILASHSQVEGTMELPDIISIARRLSGKTTTDGPSLYPQVLADMKPEQLRELGEEYLERTRVHRTDTPYFIDKMPNNFSHVGLIHLIQNFSYSLEEIGRYYQDYVELMTHWDKVLPGRVLRMNYEDVVADIDTEVHRLLDHCGLPFEPACLEFHKTERSVRTASSEQVRQPLYAGAVEQWRNFEPWLGRLAELLEPVLMDQKNTPAA